MEFESVRFLNEYNVYTLLTSRMHIQIQNVSIHFEPYILSKNI